MFLVFFFFFKKLSIIFGEYVYECVEIHTHTCGLWWQLDEQYPYHVCDGAVLEMLSVPAKPRLLLPVCHVSTSSCITNSAYT